MPIITPVGGNGGDSSLLWTQFDSISGAQILSGQAGSIAWTPSFFGSGTLASVTAQDIGDGPGTAIVFTDPGQYLISVNAGLVDGAFDNVVDTSQVRLEVQVFNNENDPYMHLPIRAPGTGDPVAASGMLTPVIGIYSDDAAPWGFNLTVLAEDVDFTPPDDGFFMKVVQLATA